MKIEFDIEKFIEPQFDEIAKKLFNETLLVVNEYKYYLTEIEFYVFNQRKHSDPFVHKNDLQLHNNSWYFHGSGLDITIGDKKTTTYGGILIRGVKYFENEEHEIYIDGPLNVVREIFSRISLIEHCQNIGLKKFEKTKSGVFKTMRVGLKKKAEDLNNEFLTKKYRYLIDLKAPHKYKEKDKTEIHKEYVN